MLFRILGVLLLLKYGTLNALFHLLSCTVIYLFVYLYFASDCSKKAGLRGCTVDWDGYTFNVFFILFFYVIVFYEVKLKEMI